MAQNNKLKLSREKRLLRELFEWIARDEQNAATLLRSIELREYKIQLNKVVIF